MALTKVPSNLDSVTATTQSQGDGSTNVATTAYVDTGLANLIDSAPSNLNTLNELAAAMNDNASFFSTVLPLSGGTMTGALTSSANISTTGSGSMFISNSSSSGDYIRIYAGSGTGKWDIYGNGANLRIGDNETSQGAITIDTNVGIGTTSPESVLHANGANNDTYGQLRVTSPSNGDAQISFGTTTNGRGMYVDDSDTNKFKIYTGHGKGTSGKEFTIDNDGKVGIGTTSPGYTLDVNGGTGTMTRITSGGSSTYLAIKNTSNTGYIGVDSNNLEFYPTGSKAATLQSNGNLFIAGTLSQSYSFSDVRLKENIENITDAINKVKQLQGITYTFKDKGTQGTGLIAQQLEKVLPQAVYEPEPQIDRDPITGEVRGETPETYKAIHYGNTVGLLVEAIKELSTKLEAAETRITELEG